MKLTQEQFIERSNKAHNNKYDYSKTAYVNAHTKVTVICPVHGEFSQIANDHKRGVGCKKCGIDTIYEKAKSTLEEFVTKARLVHGDKFNYSLAKYKNSTTDIDIICPIHGTFKQKPAQHLRTTGCHQCGIAKFKKTNSNTTNEFIKKAKKIHGYKFNYSLVEYTNSKGKVRIICDQGHEYLQSPNDHMGGHGCSECAQDMHESLAEKEVLNFVRENTALEVLSNTRSVISPYELDIYIPDLNLAIEFNGLYWHSEKHKSSDYHIKKFNMCASKGVRLVQIWEDEWINKSDLCRSFLKSLISQPIRAYARKLIIKEVPLEEQRTFLNKHHFQGYTASTSCFGLYSKFGVLFQVMSLKKLDSNGNYEIGRLCTTTGFIIIGGAERLLKHLLQYNTCTTLISYNNLDKFTGGVYARLGMKLDKAQINSYFYTNGVESFSRQQFQKAKLVAQGHDPSLTEYQIANSMGYFRVFPTGNSRYSMTF